MTHWPVHLWCAWHWPWWSDRNTPDCVRAPSPRTVVEEGGGRGTRFSLGISSTSPGSWVAHPVTKALTFNNRNISYNFISQSCNFFLSSSCPEYTRGFVWFIWEAKTGCSMSDQVIEVLCKICMHKLKNRIYLIEMDNQIITLLLYQH